MCEASVAAADGAGAAAGSVGREGVGRGAQRGRRRREERRAGGWDRRRRCRRPRERVNQQSLKKSLKKPKKTTNTFNVALSISAIKLNTIRGAFGVWGKKRLEVILHRLHDTVILGGLRFRV